MYQQSKVLIQHLLAQITRAWTMTSSAIHGRITIFTIFSYFLLINGAAAVLKWIFGTAASQNVVCIIQQMRSHNDLVSQNDL